MPRPTLLLYYITDRSQLPGEEAARRGLVLEKIAEAARCGVDYIQLREKDLSTRELELLAGKAVQAVRSNSTPRTENQALKTRLLVNSRTDVALAAGADGVHLRSDGVLPSDVRHIWSQCGAGTPAGAMVGVSCHSAEEVRRAAVAGADFAVFGPVFGKAGFSAAGLEALRHASQHEIPVLALGGVTLENTRSCLEAGAAGIAGIRLFQESEICRVVDTIRRLRP